MQSQRYLQPLDQAQALALLAGAAVGRIAFVSGGRAEIRPVNHALVDGYLVLGSHVGTALVDAVRPGRVPVAYEVDELNAAERSGWSVLVRGLAGLVLDDAELDRYAPLVRPWIDQPMDQIVRIEVQLVTGFRLVD